ncbi:FkbM family methyltransferase [Candidatus Pacearchaeota archaeon]|nr:FkbM family methyltransferase [Candidatus Pacearchaeota archaeon]
MRKVTKNKRFFFVRDDFSNPYTKYNLFKFWSKVEKGIWEPETFEILDKYLDKNSTYLDLGAWMGPTVLYGAGIAKKTYAVEPDPVAYRELKENIRLNPKIGKSIHTFNLAISGCDGHIKMGNDSMVGDSSSTIILRDTNKFFWDVKSFKFDTFIKKYKIEDCNFIKIDIEGGEMIILPTMLKYLRKNKPTIYLSLHLLPLKYKLRYLRSILPLFFVYDNVYLNSGKKINYSYFIAYYFFYPFFKDDSNALLFTIK